MADITPTNIDETGVKQAFAACSAGGDKIVMPGSGLVMVEFRNTDSSSHTVTLDAPALVINDPTYGRVAKSDPSVILAASEECVFFIKHGPGLKQSDGKIWFTYSAETGMKIRAIKVQ